MPHTAAHRGLLRTLTLFRNRIQQLLRAFDEQAVPVQTTQVCSPWGLQGEEVKKGRNSVAFAEGCSQ